MVLVLSLSLISSIGLLYFHYEMMFEIAYYEQKLRNHNIKDSVQGKTLWALLNRKEDNERF